MSGETCQAAASQCRCGKPAGHVDASDPTHECEDQAACGGAWTGTFEAGDFAIVRLPILRAPMSDDLVVALFAGLKVPRGGIRYPGSTTPKTEETQGETDA